MPRFRLILGVLFGFVLVAVVISAIVRFYSAAPAARPLDLRQGDQEIAWFHTATSAATWERFVTGAHRAARQDPALKVDDSRAFLDETTAVPELVLRHGDSPEQLHIRWYKQSSQTTVSDWVRALAERDPPPLAILGGGSSDRALELARILVAQTQWRGQPPLLLLTTATANTVYMEAGGLDARRDLMKVYPNRTFRFCFTNRQMARAVLDFIWRMPELRPRGYPAPWLGAAGLAAAGDPLGCAAMIAQSEFAPEVFALEWQDDPYSVDLSEQFREVFYLAEDNAPWTYYGRSPPQILRVPSSIGGFLRPNPGEAAALDMLVNPDPPVMFRSLPRNGIQRSLLILPAIAAPARRLLASLVGADAVISRSVVAVSGDSISFNNVYRDAELLWNMNIVPVPLVFFTHENPVDWDAEELPKREYRDPFALYPPNGTDDVLHFATVVRQLSSAAWSYPSDKERRLMPSDSDWLAKKLRDQLPSFFDVDGNRLGGSGENIVFLRPQSADGLVSSTIEVWTHRDESGWRLVKRLPVHYR